MVSRERRVREQFAAEGAARRGWLSVWFGLARKLRALAASPQEQLDLCYKMTTTLEFHGAYAQEMLEVGREGGL